jgi:hypothetical protein
MQNGSGQTDNRVVPSGEILVGVAEIGAFLRLNPRTVSNLIKRDALPVTRCGLGWLTTKGAVVRWLERRAEGRING